jgi:hypothetical protein
MKLLLLPVLLSIRLSRARRSRFQGYDTDEMTVPTACHTSCAIPLLSWVLTIRIDPSKLVRLMGHGSKRMVFDVYGDYIEGLEEDFWHIPECMGNDCVGSSCTPSSITNLQA